MFSECTSDNISFADATPTAVASFSDARCTAGGVCPKDPLDFTCEVNESTLLRVILPTGDQEVASFGDTCTASDVALPAGFFADSLVVTPIDDLRRNITLTIYIENASLLDGGQITCDDTVLNNIMAMTGCPLAGEPTTLLFKKSIHVQLHG